MKLKITLFFCLLSLVGYAQNSTLKHHNVKTIALYKVQGYLEHLPPGYDSDSTKKYPLLVFLHGAGERGSTPEDLYKVAKNGPPKEIEEQGSLCFEVNGKEECFIVLSPQLTGSGNWTGYAQKEFWDYILHGPNNYRYDPNRIYLTGLSLGGNGVWERAYDDENEDNNLAAIAPLCSWGNNSKGCIVADRNIPVWAFHGTSDDVIGFNAGLSMFNAVNDCPSNTQDNIFTPVEGGEHWIWNDIYKTDHSAYDPNIYEWLLNHTLHDNTGFSDTISNQAPIVQACQDVNSEVGVDAIYLNAVASDPDGYVTTYKWEEMSGPTASLLNVDSASLILANPDVGTYEFKVTVTDDQGAIATDHVFANILDSANQSPMVYAGPDINTTLDANQIYLIAEASDPDGSIVSYKWTKVSGPTVKLWNPDRDKLTLVKFTTGTYVLNITVEDNNGSHVSDQVTVVVTDDSSPDDTDDTTTSSLIKEKVSSDGMSFLEYLPSSYNDAIKYPVILYLHSKTAEGSNLDLLKNEGPMYFVNQGTEICSNGECFIVLSPQINKGSGFWKGKVDRFYNYLVNNYSVDFDRIYLAGFDEGAQDGLMRLTDNTNTPNRWAAMAGVSYSAAASNACDIASSGSAFYLANSTTDEVNNYDAALDFYNQLDECASSSTNFVSQSGDQEQSEKNFFNPDITDLYSWLLNHSSSTKPTSGARMTGQKEELAGELSKNQLENKQKNFLTKANQLSLTSTNDMVKIEIKSMLGITVKRITSHGTVPLNDLGNGIYIYTIVDEDNNPLQKGRIIKR